MKALALSLAVVLSSAPAAFAAHVTAQPTLTLEGAKRAVAAAILYARAHGAPGAVIFDDRRKQLPLSGVYSCNDDRLRPELEGPNGIVFSPLQPGVRS
jgi:hypothetical protein